MHTDLRLGSCWYKDLYTLQCSNGSQLPNVMSCNISCVVLLFCTKKVRRIVYNCIRLTFYLWNYFVEYRHCCFHYGPNWQHGNIGSGSSLLYFKWPGTRFIKHFSNLFQIRRKFPFLVIRLLAIRKLSLTWNNIDASTENNSWCRMKLFIHSQTSTTVNSSDFSLGMWFIIHPGV